MKPIASTITEVDTFDADEVHAKVSVKNSAWIMRSMADLYSNKELACVREYSTNAFDSNYEKALRDGETVRPIEVTLPSALNPYFTVQDFGVGMSEETMREVYLTFGESSKRDSDDFNGMLGFGSKSAVAYTNTFTVTSVHQGIKTVGVVSRREDAMGGYLISMKMVITGLQTTDPDGVTIQIPVHNHAEFAQKAMDFYRFWEPGRVLVNGKEPQQVVGEKIDDNLFYNAQQGTSYVVMGNVPYRIANPDALFPRGMNRISFVAYVPVGAVEFTPAREALKYSDHTNNALHKIIGDFVAKSVDLAKKEISESKTHAEAYLNWVKWRKVIGAEQVADLTFKGDALVHSFKIAAQRYQISSYRYGTWGINDWQIDSMANTIIVTGFDINLASAHKKKVKDWLGLKGINANYVLFTTQKDVDCVWVDPARVVEWETVKAEAPKAPRPVKAASTAPGRLAGTFDLVSANGMEWEQDVPDTKELWYITVKEFNQVERHNIVQVLTMFKMDAKIVKVPANRMDKFLRSYPHAQSITAHFEKSVVLDGPSLLSADAKTYLKTHQEDKAALRNLDSKKVDDPELKRLIEIMRKPEAEYIAEYNKHERLSVLTGTNHKFKQHKWTGYWDATDRPLTKDYPLATAARTGKNLNHITIYINSVYKARKAGINV